MIGTCVRILLAVILATHIAGVAGDATTQRLKSRLA